MASHTPSEERQIEVNRDSHLGRIAWRAQRISVLRRLLSETDRRIVLADLSQTGLGLPEGFEDQDLPAIQETIRETITQLQAMNDETPGLATAVEERLIGTSKAATKIVDSRESQNETPKLAELRADYNRIVAFVKDVKAKQKQELQRRYAWDYLKRMADMPWEQVLARLGEKNTANPEKTNLEMLTAMQGGGEMIGVDEDGKILGKDRGTEPVMFGFDKSGKAMMIYDRDERQMAQLEEEGAKIADYYGIYEAVYGLEGKPTGYELFPEAPYGEATGAIAAFEATSKTTFVRNANGKDLKRPQFFGDGFGDFVFR